MARACNVHALPPTAIWCLTKHPNEIGHGRPSCTLSWRTGMEEEVGEERWGGDERGGSNLAEPLGASSLSTLVVRSIQMWISLYEPTWIQKTSQMWHTEQALHKAAPVSSDCIQTKTGKTAKFLGVCVIITDQINLLWAQASTLLNHKAAIYCSVGVHQRISLAFFFVF